MNICDFELDVELSVSLVECRPILWDKTDDIYKQRNETKMAWGGMCIGVKEDFEAPGDVCDEGTKKTEQ